MLLLCKQTFAKLGHRPIYISMGTIVKRSHYNSANFLRHMLIHMKDLREVVLFYLRF